ncbi:MAG: nuclear transport factor 2 family protein [Anaerolineaceae bacterium]|nr:nuclear transport factor 2 family protein [Anaerolineaceae bacterium]
MANSLAQAKQLVWDFALAREAGPDARRRLDRFLAPELEWQGIQPLRRLEGRDAFYERFLQPLYHAFPDWRRRPCLFLGGEFEGKVWVAGMGDAIGSFVKEWTLAPDLVIPPTGFSLRTRYGEFCRVESGRIVEIRYLMDLPALLLQAGIELIPPGAAHQIWPPGPATGDGLRHAERDPAESARTLALVEAMIFGGLNKYDGRDPDSQDLVQYWHPQMTWHGPRGTGSSLNLDEFRHLAQAPFLRMTPDRKGVGHRARIAEGHYAASTGWPASVGTMTGDFLDWPASGREMRLNVMDFWRREGDMLREDWVLIDMIDAAAQAGVDVWQKAGLR